MQLYMKLLWNMVTKQGSSSKRDYNLRTHRNYFNYLTSCFDKMKRQRDIKYVVMSHLFNCCSSNKEGIKLVRLKLEVIDELIIGDLVLTRRRE
jgi:acetone carboxylase gamma subunit